MLLKTVGEQGEAKKEQVRVDVVKRGETDSR